MSGMPFLRLLPVMVAWLLLAAHLFRAGSVALVIAGLGCIALLWVRRPWVPRLQVVLLLVAAAEWVRTLVSFAGARVAAGQPWLRLALILGTVALVTALAALVFRAATVRRWFHPQA